MHLFAGAGGGILADLLLGHQPVCAVEINEYCQQVLSARQKDCALPWFPIFADVKQFDGKPWRGIVDVISGGFPCQDISIAGKGVGIRGERSGMWKEFLRIICDIRPRFVFVENSPMLTSRGLGVVLGDLASAGYDTEWTCLSAAEVGANHVRDRIWILGHSNDYGQVTAEVVRSATEGSYGCETRKEQACKSARSGQQYAELADTNRNNDKKRSRGRAAECCKHNSERLFSFAPRKSCGEKFGATSGKIPDPDRAQCQRMQRPKRINTEYANFIGCDWWKTEPEILRVVDGMAARLDFVNDQLKAIGNGQVPLAAAEAFKELINRFMEK